MANVQTEAKELRQNFRHILINLRQHLKREGLGLTSFKHKLLNLPVSERLKDLPLLQNNREDIRNADSFESIIAILNSYWNYLDCSLLKEVVKMCSTDKLGLKVDAYAVKVTKFKAKFVIEELVKVWDERPFSPLAFVSFQIQSNLKPSKRSLDQLDIATLLCKHLSINPSALLLYKISCNPLVVTWLLPPCIEPQLREEIESTSSESLLFKRQITGYFEIHSIKLHGAVVYDPVIASKLQQGIPKDEKPSEVQVENSQFYLVNGPVPDSYLCKFITNELLLYPYTTTCCGEHISKEAKKRLQQCPYCKSTLVTKEDKAFQREVMALEVYCQNYTTFGCPWKGPIGNHSAHLKSCSFESIACLDCGQNVRRCEIENHQSNQCPKCPSSCEYCEYSSSYEDVMSHQDECGNRSLTCPNGCDKYMLYKGLKQHLDRCQLQLVQCKYSSEGCTAKVQRKDLPSHMKENLDLHLYMIKQMLEAESESLKSIQSSLYNVPQIVPEISLYYTEATKSTSLFSSPFYTHNGGYRMCLRVDINGYGSEAGTRVSIYIHLMRGMYDGDLKFPFQGEVTVQLVNQLESGRPSEGHIERTIMFNEEAIDHYGCRVIGDDETQYKGRGLDQLVAHKQLDRYVTQVGEKKCIKFRILRTVVYSK